MRYNAQTGQWENESEAPAIDMSKWTAARDKVAAAAPALAPQPGPATGAPQNLTMKIDSGNSTTTATSQATQTEEEKRLQANMGKLEDDQVAIQTRQNEINTEKARIEQEKAAENAIRKTELEQKKQAILTESDARMKAGVAEAEDQYEKFKAMEIKDFWADKSTGAKVAAAIAVGMGAFGAALSGGKNDAMTIMQSAIEQDFNKQRANILQQKDVVTQAYGSVDQGNKWMEMQLGRLDLKEAAAMDRVASTIADKKARMGASEQEIAGDATINGLRQQSAQRKASVEQGLRQKVETVTKLETQNLQLDQFGRPINPKSPGYGEGIKALDKDYAKDFNDYTSQGRVNAQASIQKLEAIQQQLEKEAGSIFEAGGGKASALPDSFRTQKSIELRDNAQNAANATLKSLFGGQLSDGERKAAAGEFYNDKLDSQANAGILKQKIQQMKDAAAQEDAKAAYFEKNGTLNGYRANTAAASFPRTVTKGNQSVDVLNEDELREAQEDGFQ